MGYMLENRLYSDKSSSSTPKSFSTDLSPASSQNLSLLKNFINTIDSCIHVVNSSSKIILVNTHFIKKFGYSEDEIINKKLSKVFPSFQEENDPNLKNILNKDKFEKIIPAIHKDGTKLDCFVKGKHLDDIPVVLFNTEILSDSVSVIKDLEEKNSKYHTIFNELKDCVYETTPDGSITELNPSGVEMIGYSSFEEIKSLNIGKDFYVDIDLRSQFKKELAKKGFVKDFEYDIRKRNGEIITILDTAIAVKNDKGKIICYRGIMRDITEYKKAEKQSKELMEKLAKLNQQLTESETELKNINTSKDRFFSIIAHDLRSPFTSLLGFSEFLDEDIDDLSPEEIKLFASKIHEASSDVFNLLENLLQWSRIQTGRLKYEPARFNLAQVVGQNINLLFHNAENKKIEIINEVPANIAVYADETMVNSILQNLISNAIKFTKPEGKITLYSEQYDHFYKLSVKDTGIGIKHEDMDKLFRIDCHHTTAGTNDEKGTGLGLILCKELITKNKGSIWVESSEDYGTTFSFTLPLSQAS